MAKGLIYKATNKINGKSYVGQTIFTLAERIDGHIKSATKKDSPYHFHKAIRKYGEENFDWETICNCNGHGELNDKEIFYIPLSYFEPYGIPDGTFTPKTLHILNWCATGCDTAIYTNL